MLVSVRFFSEPDCDANNHLSKTWGNRARFLSYRSLEEKSRMKHLVTLSLFLQLAGACSTSVNVPDATLPEVAEAPSGVESEFERELAARRALERGRQAEAEAAAQRFERETVVIGEQEEENQFEVEFFEEEPDADAFAEADEERGESPRPVLRLYGVPPAPEPSVPAEPWPAMTHVLPVAQPGARAAALPSPANSSAGHEARSSAPPAAELPWQQQDAASGNAAPSGATSQAEYLAALAAHMPAVQEQGAQDPQQVYRAALQLFQQRDFDESRAAFEHFLQRFPTDQHAAGARYWRAESMYLARDYGRARVAFEGFLRRHGNSDRAPDALLRSARCSARLGDLQGAREAADRLVREYPESDAASVAVGEAGR